MVKPEECHTHFYYKDLNLVGINSVRNLQKSVFKKKNPLDFVIIPHWLIESFCFNL